jgi:hypothetical protein
MIMSVSTLIILSGAATPSSVVNLSIISPEHFGIVLFQDASGVCQVWDRIAGDRE